MREFDEALARFDRADKARRRILPYLIACLVLLAALGLFQAVLLILALVGVVK